jgi:hypothetical protein
MVVNQLHLIRILVLPPEAQAPLLIDADAVLTLPISLQRFELIGGRDHKVPKIDGRIEVFELLAHPLLNSPIHGFDEFAAENSLSFPALEGTNHRGLMLMRSVINVKR